MLQILCSSLRLLSTGLLNLTRTAPLQHLAVFSTGQDIASITHLEVKCLLFSRVGRQMSPSISCLCETLGVNYALKGQMSLFFFQGSETNVPTYFLSVLNTALTALTYST